MLGDLAIDRASAWSRWPSARARRTATEYRLLHALSLDAGGATTYESLPRRVWSGRATVETAGVRSAMRRLGDDAGRPKYILAERGLGYRIPKPDEP